jgi:hypothetical protein
MRDAMSVTPQVVSMRFVYDGKSRIVDNVQIKNNCVVGYEMRRSGKFSNSIKSFSLAKIGAVEFIKIEREDRPEVPAFHSFAGVAETVPVPA